MHVASKKLSKLNVDIALLVLIKSHIRAQVCKKCNLNLISFFLSVMSFVFRTKELQRSCSEFRDATLPHKTTRIDIDNRYVKKEKKKKIGLKKWKN